VGSNRARVLSGSFDKTIKLWDAATGTLIRTFEGHSSEVSSVAFSADGARVLSGSNDGTIKLWDAATGALTRGSTASLRPLETSDRSHASRRRAATRPCSAITAVTPLPENGVAARAPQ
jgi:WD40 repeat protein